MHLEEWKEVIMEYPDDDDIDFFLNYFAKLEDFAIKHGIVCEDIEACVNVLTYIEEMRG